MRITVVIPVYNEARYIERCLNALESQSRQPDKVIIVDNNCTDDTINIAEHYSFVSIVKESRQGICAATKRGFDSALAGADIIMRCDADSVPYPDWISVAESYFADDKIIAITGPGEFVELHGWKRWLADIFYMKMYFWSVGMALGQKPLFGSNFALTASTWSLISHSTHLDNQNLHDDIDISFHVSKLGAITYIPQYKMPISHRPFASFHKFARRYPIGLKSITIHWPDQSPWRRP